MLDYLHGKALKIIAEAHSSVGSAQDLRTGGHWLHPRLRQYSYQGLMTFSQCSPFLRR